MSMLNGIDAAEFAEAVSSVQSDPELGQRRPRLTAEWVGGYQSRVRIDGKSLEVSGPGQLDAMQLVLAAYASCVIEMVATHATLMGLAVQSLELELDAQFDIRRYLGLEGPAPGYDRLRLTARLRADGITAEQVGRLQDLIERASPVGATLAGPLHLEPRLEVVTEQASG